MMDVSRLVGALLPIFFVLLLGYIAGKRRIFSSEQAAGLSTLALSFALPAALFVSMTEVPRELLLQQGRLILALLLSHVGLFLLALLILARSSPSLKGTPSVMYALVLSSSAAPIFGISVLRPLLGDTSAGTVCLVALAIDFVIPLSIIFFEMNDAGSTASHGATTQAKDSPVMLGVKGGLKSPLLWAPVLGIVSVLAGIHFPKEVASSFAMIGSATSGVSLFTIGLILAAHAFHVSEAVVLGTLGRISVQTAVLFVLFRFLHVKGQFAREALVCTSFPMATVVVLFAAKYKSVEKEAASILLLSTVCLLVTVPITLAIGS